MPKWKTNFKTNIFGRIVYQAVRKYINPSCYRQIIETESIEKPDITEQENVSEEHVSEDQKHNPAVAKMHYLKRKSEDIAVEAKDHG